MANIDIDMTNTNVKVYTSIENLFLAKFSLFIRDFYTIHKYPLKPIVRKSKMSSRKYTIGYQISKSALSNF